MKIKLFFLSFVLLLNLALNVMAQNTDTTSENPPTAPPSSTPTPTTTAETTNVKTKAEEPKNNSPGAGASDKPEQTTTTIAPLVEYLNERITKTLAENPVKFSPKLRLGDVFNAERKKVEDARIDGSTITTSSAMKVEEALENFRAFLSRYQKLEGVMENALDDLTKTNENPNISLELKFKALLLLDKLKWSSTLEEAKKAVNSYKEFKQSKGLDGPTTNHSQLDKQNKNFELFLEVLKKSSKKVKSSNEKPLNKPKKKKKINMDYDGDNYGSVPDILFF